jgi:uncharacterized repeat protein (TIGR01451 family)
VLQAALALEASGPEKVYADRHAVLQYSVMNTGTAPAELAMLEAPVPTGTKFVSATEGGKLSGNVVRWDLRTIPAKGARKLAMTVDAQTIGEFEAAATAKAECATSARDTAMVSVVGIPALLLEVTDLLDPIEVGSQTEYEIVVINQGSAAATNVKVTAMLEESEQFVSSSGARSRAAGNVVTFETIPTIAPKATATLRLAVNCVKEGDCRFRVSMTADQLTRPVEESESTHIYR